MTAHDAHIAVVGAGVFGAWTADHLLGAGHRVTLIDALGPANALASSGGESRLIRAAYGKDEIYTRMARDSLPRWRDLSALAGLPIFMPHGILFFFAREESYFRDTVETHACLGLPTEILTRAEMAGRFPMMDFDGISVGLFEPAFGALMARRAVQTLVDNFVRAGGAYVAGNVRPPASPGTRLDQVTLSSGDRIGADQFVFAAGPWLPRLFPNVIGGRIRPTRQEVFFFAPPAGDARFGPESMPGWADYNDGDMFYGFPDLESRGVKLAHDVHGPEVDPDTQDRRPTRAALDTVVAYRDRRFPALRCAPLTESRVCQYENSSNGDLLIDFHPHLENVLLVGGGSGHGFKHGPEVGRYAASLLAGRATVEPRFSLATKSLTHARAIR
ncbi:MAG TPA: FAD-dependent oxidoreductase [Sphingomicrobium sp.]|nr:FAD-dependent oxidoreductase [Sphingomicrobium sp.]